MGDKENPHMKPDLVAPGTNILSACHRDNPGAPANGLIVDSMSVPFVTGAAALITQYYEHVHSNSLQAQQASISPRLQLKLHGQNNNNMYGCHLKQLLIQA
jgi:hypothetical protein